MKPGRFGNTLSIGLHIQVPLKMSVSSINYMLYFKMIFI